MFDLHLYQVDGVPSGLGAANLSANITTSNGLELTLDIITLTYEECRNKLGIATCGKTTMVIEIPSNPEGESEPGGVSGSIFLPDHLFHIYFQFEYVRSRTPSILHVSNAISYTGKFGEIIEVRIKVLLQEVQGLREAKDAIETSSFIPCICTLSGHVWFVLV